MSTGSVTAGEPAPLPARLAPFRAELEAAADGIAAAVLLHEVCARAIVVLKEHTFSPHRLRLKQATRR